MTYDLFFFWGGGCGLCGTICIKNKWTVGHPVLALCPELGKGATLHMSVCFGKNSIIILQMRRMCFPAVAANSYSLAWRPLWRTKGPECVARSSRNPITRSINSHQRLECLMIYQVMLTVRCTFLKGNFYSANISFCCLTLCD